MANIVLLQQDLRLHDNPALFYAAKQEDPLIIVYVKPKKMGTAGLWWLQKSLVDFHQSLQIHGLSLLYFDGQIKDLLDQFDAQSDQLFINHLDQSVIWPKDKVHMFYPNLLFYPHHLQKPFKIFTPFWKYCQANYPAPPEPLSLPSFKRQHVPSYLPSLSTYPALTGSNWWQYMEDFWHVSEKGAQERLQYFLTHGLKNYDHDRDLPFLDHTSRLSPYLHLGQISARLIWHTIKNMPPSVHHNRFLSELGWREFAYHLQEFHPDMAQEPMRISFKFFPWLDNPDYLEAWQKGMTGYPIVDAGMRQLWQTGWMHNRVRMIVGSFLTKNLLQPWQQGEAWFFDTLVDGDAAVNAMNWQWVAGCGTDSAPYFRIFNPVLQGQKFDPKGIYIKTWVKELADVDERFIHEPWLSHQLLTTYPSPIVDLKISRQKALSAFQVIK